MASKGKTRVAGAAPLKLGKTPARKGAIKFKLTKYLAKAGLPTPPKVFGDQALIGRGWMVLGNNTYADCVWAGAAHETMLWNKEAGRVVTFSRAGVLSDYGRVTGFKLGDRDSDKGTDIQKAASYRRRTGVIDAKGKRHKIAAYLALKPGDMKQLALAMYCFGAVGIGLRLPVSADTQFRNNRVWSVKKGSRFKGGHYVPGLGIDRRGNIVVVTWGYVQRMTPGFYKKYCDEVIAYVSPEALRHGETRNGLKLGQLRKDLRALGR